MRTFADRKQEEFCKLLDRYRQERGKEPDSIDLGIMLREAAERARKVPEQEGSKA